MDQQQQEQEVDYGYGPQPVRRRSRLDLADIPRPIGDTNDCDNYSFTFGEGEETEGDSFHDESKEAVAHREEVTEVERLAKKNTFKIRIGRFCVILIFLSLGAILSMATYFSLRRWDEDDFIEGFDMFSRTIQDSLEFKTSRLVGALRGLSLEMTAYSRSSENPFPNVTVPLFEVNAYNARSESNIDFISFLPLVRKSERLAWEDYAVQNQWWIDQSHTVEQQRGSSGMSIPGNLPISTFITERDAEGTGRAPERDMYAPFWLSSPPYTSLVGRNALTRDLFGKDLNVSFETREIIFGDVINASSVYNNNFIPTQDPQPNMPDRPCAVIFAPVFQTLDPKSDVVGFLVGLFDFALYLSDLFPADVAGFRLVMKNTRGETYTYCLQGNQALFCGIGDNHDRSYDGQRFEIPIRVNDLSQSSTQSVEGIADYSVDVYPTSDFEDKYVSSAPSIATIVVAVVFISMGLAFSIYDRFVQSKNNQVVGAAARATAILSSLFPAQVRDRLFASATSKVEEEEERKSFKPGAQTRLRRFLNNENDEEENEGQDKDTPGQMSKTKPIADLFPETTVMFGDIVGFTAWSSVREPAQVFTLLETLYASFDEIAKRRRVFKVETVGDCYVAVTGLPDPRKDHAVAMARFARDCMQRMDYLTKSMEVELGPETGELCMRVGLHSGPVTAGVLRGDRARFQLFGDTMNTAARMESTGTPRKIQMSEETAELLRLAGKVDWALPREDPVIAKGKGTLKTFWLALPSGERRNTSTHFDKSMPFRRPSMVQNFIISDTGTDKVTEKMTRLIEWNVEVLLRLLKLTVGNRKAAEQAAAAAAKKESNNRPTSLLNRLGRDANTRSSKTGASRGGEDSQSSRKTEDDVNASKNFAEESAPKTPLEEVVEVIRLPDFDANSKIVSDPDCVGVDALAIEQLSDLVAQTAGLYSRSNPFHNFEHASHVTMSVVKLLSRIVAPELNVNDGEMSKGKRSLEYVLHDHTYGITSDPLTQFACVYSALVHDVDHQGVPNAQLVKENLPIAEKFKGKSVAEQNSVEIAWNLFMEDRFTELRNTICATKNELKRLRQLVVNSVMATDIMDKDLKALRNARWEKAFSESAVTEASTAENRNRKATIVIEHLIQASDVAHTMQHWHIYRKWNERLFTEMVKAFDDGRAEKHPSEFWYNGEIGFFDFYIIPLAKKLKDCGVFGVSSDEYLNYAMKNRAEWETRGQEVIGEMLEKLRSSGVSAVRWQAEQRAARSKPGTPDGAGALPDIALPKRANRRFSAGSQLSDDSNNSRGFGGIFGGSSHHSRTSRRPHGSNMGQFFVRRYSGDGQTKRSSPFSRRLSGDYQPPRRSDSPRNRRFSAGFIPSFSNHEPTYSRRYSAGFSSPPTNRRFSGGWFKEQYEDRDVAINQPKRSNSKNFLPENALVIPPEMTRNDSPDKSKKEDNGLSSSTEDSSDFPETRGSSGPSVDSSACENSAPVAPAPNPTHEAPKKSSFAQKTLNHRDRSKSAPSPPSRSSSGKSGAFENKKESVPRSQPDSRPSSRRPLDAVEDVLSTGHPEGMRNQTPDATDEPANGSHPKSKVHYGEEPILTPSKRHQAHHKSRPGDKSDAVASVKQSPMGDQSGLRNSTSRRSKPGAHSASGKPSGSRSPNAVPVGYSASGKQSGSPGRPRSPNTALVSYSASRKQSGSPGRSRSPDAVQSHQSHESPQSSLSATPQRRKVADEEGRKMTQQLSQPSPQRRQHQNTQVSKGVEYDKEGSTLNKVSGTKNGTKIKPKRRVQSGRIEQEKDLVATVDGTTLVYI